MINIKSSEITSFMNIWLIVCNYNDKKEKICPRKKRKWKKSFLFICKSLNLFPPVINFFFISTKKNKCDSRHFVCVNKWNKLTLVILVYSLPTKLLSTNFNIIFLFLYYTMYKLGNIVFTLYGYIFNMQYIIL